MSTSIDLSWLFAKKEDTLDAASAAVRDAFYAESQSTVPMMATQSNPIYPAYIYSDYLVACRGAQYFRYDYKKNADGNIEFGDPIAVEMTWKPVKE